MGIFKYKLLFSILMEGFEVKDKKFFLFFEFLGTMVLTIAFNMCGLQAQASAGVRSNIISKTIFIISLISWEISSAHFNSAITLGAWICAGDYKKNLTPMFAIIMMQCFGAATATFFTWYFSSVDPTT